MDKRPRKVIKETVRRRIEELLEESRQAYRSHPERSTRYLKLLWKLVEKYKVRLTRGQKLSFCRNCFIPWIPGRNITIRFEQRNCVMEYECRNCGYKRRVKYK